ncbi:MAG TPA: phenylalanine--tRNA ligase subunit beta [Burkholderiaceae bacterium]|nr:phenylalanine--tRNA ligase subunit beta [Burkholderiaceae bacterium]
MQFPESWLRQFANPSINTEELAHKLTMAGLEVEELEPAAPAFENVVVAEVVSLEKHPNADKLHICQVNNGSDELIQIVCGAPNVRVGMKAPLAQIGATLPGNFKIRKAKMRGVESFGMLCSGDELGLSQDSDGLLELSDKLAVGQCLRQALKLDETIFTLSLTPNRADCLSILGIAREVSALSGCTLKKPSITPIKPSINETLPVTIHAPDLCGRFAGRIMRNVNAAAATPDWMVERLERAGQRSLSVLVDISNYVMLELGQPNHVFDLDKIQGSLDVRWGQAGEQVTLLNGQTITVNPEVGVISSGKQIESLAGIMGAESSSVTTDTRNVYLEAAFWWPEAIMGRARNYKFSSEASHRFERGVDYSTVTDCLEYMTSLIIDICGGEAGPLNDQIINLPERKPVAMRVNRCERLLGISLNEQTVATIFHQLGMPFTVDQGVFSVTPPAYRFDIAIEEDLVEEVARIYGFERLPDRPPKADAIMRVAPETHRSPHSVRHTLAALDYQEVINFSFVEERWEATYTTNKNPIRLLNPIASQLAVMRSSLIPGLVDTIKRNANRRETRVRIFEIGRIFVRDEQVQDSDLTVAGIHQPQYLGGAAWGPASPEQWASPTRQVDFFDIKNDIENLFGRLAPQLRWEAQSHPALHPGRSAKISLNQQPIGWAGELHPALLNDAGLKQAPIVFELELEALLQQPMAQPVPLSRQPIVTRDLAFWVDNAVSYQQLYDTLMQAIRTTPELHIVHNVRLFDVWQNPSQEAHQTEKSMALHFWLQSPDTTLDEATIDHCIKTLLAVLVQEYGVRQRA